MDPRRAAAPVGTPEWAGLPAAALRGALVLAGARAAAAAAGVCRAWRDAAAADGELWGRLLDRDFGPHARMRAPGEHARCAYRRLEVARRAWVEGELEGSTRTIPRGTPGIPAGNDATHALMVSLPKCLAHAGGDMVATTFAGRLLVCSGADAGVERWTVLINTPRTPLSSLCASEDLICVLRGASGGGDASAELLVFERSRRYGRCKGELTAEDGQSVWKRVDSPLALVTGATPQHASEWCTAACAGHLVLAHEAQRRIVVWSARRHAIVYDESGVIPSSAWSSGASTNAERRSAMAVALLGDGSVHDSGEALMLTIATEAGMWTAMCGVDVGCRRESSSDVTRAHTRTRTLARLYELSEPHLYHPNASLVCVAASDCGQSIAASVWEPARADDVRGAIAINADPGASASGGTATGSSTDTKRRRALYVNVCMKQPEKAADFEVRNGARTFLVALDPTDDARSGAHPPTAIGFVGFRTLIAFGRDGCIHVAHISDSMLSTTGVSVLHCWPRSLPFAVKLELGIPKGVFSESVSSGWAARGLAGSEVVFGHDAMPNGQMGVLSM
eukprot:PRCOL_00002668-RA